LTLSLSLVKEVGLLTLTEGREEMEDVEVVEICVEIDV
jgi:hypothetical protein